MLIQKNEMCEFIIFGSNNMQYKWSEWTERHTLQITLQECDEIYDSLRNSNRFTLNIHPDGDSAVRIDFHCKRIAIYGRWHYVVTNDARRSLLKVLKKHS
jgi:hypothetical protein